MRRRLEIIETISEIEGKLIAADVKAPASRRGLNLPPFVANMLAKHLARRGISAADKDTLVFVAPEGGPLRSGNFRTRVWKPAVHAAGFDGFTFHHLRHTAVGYLVETKAHPAQIQRRIGHASIRTTFDVYGHVLDTTDQATTDDLEALFDEQLDDSDVTRDRLAGT